MDDEYRKKIKLIQEMDPFVYHEQGKPVTTSTKGMIFAGCSFTWGQGLYYYSNLPSVQDAHKNTWLPSIVTFSQIEYMKTIRFPRLVANHFNTFELCQPFNGGSNETIMDFWNKSFADTPTYAKYINSTEPPQYFYDDFEYIIFQLTQWGRSKSPVDPTFTNSSFVNVNNFQGLLSNLDQYMNTAILHDLSRIKTFLQKFESRGLKVLVLSWPEDFIPYIMGDQWYKNRFVSLNYNGTVFDSIEKIMKENTSMIIRNDDTVPFLPRPLDEHPSALCHRVIANSIIKKIKETNE